ncbi:MAG: dihydrolipoamide acetyltransferase family protein [Myxococcota bacterium]|nr:dihydrolipoamide acetyltransferase family protein [Myxococcota bacterium]MEC8382802.1 dihydrolipoamide acetyltransferase family protein [Myxococcota bacterium]
MYVFDLPEVGEGVVEGEIVKWLVQPGDTIDADTPICEIMTDKATIEIPSPVAGTVTKLHGDEGDVIEVETPLIELELAEGSTAPSNNHAHANPQPVDTPPKVVTAKETPPPTAETPHSTSATTVQSGKVLASPAVRHAAAQKGIALTSVQGSGKGGRITRSDLETAPRPAYPDHIKAPPAVKVASVPTGEDQTVKIIGLRRKIAEKMRESVQLAPHFTYVDEVDATELVTIRQNLKSQAAEYGVKLTYIPFIMKALVTVFREFPTVNAVMNETEFSMTVRGEVNIGIATDTPQGLYVPVIKNVEQKSILELAIEIADITQRTREGKVQLSELTGGTFTITSVGNIGGRFATPIINHPEVAILGVNQIHDRPMVIDGNIVARKMMYLSPSFDHRVIDGAVAARFVSALKRVLENPASLLLELR